MGYNLYLAKVIGFGGESDNGTDARAVVRILPYLKGIDESQCPRYPYFFKDELLVANPDDLVWCICNDDFSLGYILGLANYNAYINEDNSFISEKDINGNTINLAPSKELKSKASDASVELLGEMLGFNNIKVTFWNDNSIHFVEKSNGGFVIAYNTGSILIMRPTYFGIKVGNCKFTMNGKNIDMSTTGSIGFGSEEINLGANPVGNIMVSNGQSGKGAIASKTAKA